MKNAVTAAICAFGLIGCVSFIITYHLRSGGAWRGNEIGIWLMISRLDLALIFAVILSRRMFGTWPGYDFVIIFLVGIFALQTFWPGKFLWRPHIYGIHPHSEEEARGTRT